jgi:hypothetical protein
LIKYDAHPLAEIFPMLPDAELHDLAEDIKKNGLRELIVLHEGQILDGRNRYRACEIAGVDARFTKFSGSSPTSFVVSANIRRRHLTPSQKAMAGAKIESFFIEEAQKRKSESQAKPGEKIGAKVRANLPGPKTEQRARDEAAKAVGSTGRSVGQAKRVLKEGGKAVVEAVEKGELSLNKAEQIVKEEPDKKKQHQLVKDATAPSHEKKRKAATGPFQTLVRQWDKASRPQQIQFAKYLLENWAPILEEAKNA